MKLNQKEKYLIKAESAIFTLENHHQKLENENTNISVCVNIIDGLLLIFEELYKITPYIKKEFEINPDNYEEFKELELNKLDIIIKERKNKIIKKYNETGQVRYYTQLVNLNDEIKEAQKTFPEYKKYLENKDIEKIILEGE